MYRTPFLLFALLFVGVLAVVPVAAQDAPATNLTDSCVTAYDPDIDYFPEKVIFENATGVDVAYFNNYKIVRTLEPYPGATEPVTYVLLQCGTPAPDMADFADGTQVIEVPAGDVIAMSTTHLAHLETLGLLGNLIGVDTFAFINNPAVRELVEAGALIEVGAGTDVNIEVVLDAEPSLVMAYAFDQDDAPVVLREADIPTAINNAWLEPTLIARAEWIKFMALFYNAEAQATTVYDEIIAEYQATAALAATVPADERVTVLWSSYSIFSEAWLVPGQETWVGALLADANIDYILMDEATEGSVPFDFEVVYDTGLETPLWIPNAFGVNTLDDLLGMDARYLDFTAVQSGRVFNNTARVNENGGNDYWETGVTNPQLILRDLVAIAYPDLLPGHEPTFYVELTATD
jgi:iron complex transport system substrate-binding protein